MLLDPETLDLAPVAPEVLARLGGDPRFKLELPASQLEIALPPARSVAGAGARSWRAARRELARAAEGLALVAGAGLHPFAPAEGAMNAGERYERIVREYGSVARRQLVFAFQVHVAVGGADRTLAVYNALRGAPAGARRAGRQCAVPRGPRHRVRLVPADRGEHAAAPGHAAGDRLVGGVVGGARLGRAVRAPARRRRSGGSSCARIRPSARSRCASPTRRPRSRRPRRSRRWSTRSSRGSSSMPRDGMPSVADRGEPLGGGAPRAGRDVRRPAHGRARRRARRAWARCSTSSSRTRRRWARAPSRRVRALARAGQRRRPRRVLRRRRPAARRRMAGRPVPGRLLTGKAQACRCCPTRAAR